MSTQLEHNANITNSNDALAIRNSVRDMMKDYQNGFFSLRNLPDVIEDLRILSLNAELAAGRAGEQGLAVRALTQHTRGIGGSFEADRLRDGAHPLWHLPHGRPSAMRSGQHGPAGYNAKHHRILAQPIPYDGQGSFSQRPPSS